MREAAIRHTSLTVFTVHEAVRGYYSGAAEYLDDPARTEEVQKAAQAEADEVLAEAGWARPGVGHGQGGARLSGRGAHQRGQATPT